MGSQNVICHPTQLNARPALTPTKHAGTRTRFTYPGGMEGWVDIRGWLYAEMVYLSADSHPSNHLIATDRVEKKCLLFKPLHGNAVMTMNRLNWDMQAMTYRESIDRLVQWKLC